MSGSARKGSRHGNANGSDTHHDVVVSLAQEAALEAAANLLRAQERGLGRVVVSHRDKARIQRLQRHRVRTKHGAQAARVLRVSRALLSSSSRTPALEPR